MAKLNSSIANEFGKKESQPKLRKVFPVLRTRLQHNKVSDEEIGLLMNHHKDNAVVIMNTIILNCILLFTVFELYF